jgi:hypothetical protein
MSIFLIIILLVHLISWVLYQKHQFKERDLYATDLHNAYEHNKKWHICKGINHLSVYVLVWSNYGFFQMVFFASVFWFGFDILCNVIVLKRAAFYVGVTADTDKFIRKVSELIKIKPEYASTLIKVLILLITYTICFSI